MFSLTGKTAIVTGGSNGIGQAISQVFAEAGAWVLIADIDEEAGEATVRGIAEAGGQAEFCRTDVALPDEAVRAVKQASEHAGRVDVLCSNAAYVEQFNALLETTPEEWDRNVRVTLMGTNHFGRESLPWMVRQKQGSIIIISSVMGMVAGPGAAAYMTIKAGLLGLTRSVAYDYGQYNIRVNALCPGSVQTRNSPEPGTPAHQWQLDRTFIGRVGEPREIGYGALYLASDESCYVTGAVLPVDGGFTSM